MRLVPVFSIITLIFVGISLAAVNAAAGPSIIADPVVQEILKQRKALIDQVKRLQKELSKLKNIPALLNGLNEFKNGLSELEGQIAHLKEIGKIKVSIVVFIETKLAACDKIVNLLIDDLSRDPPVREHYNALTKCRSYLSHPCGKRACSRIGSGGPRGFNSEQASTITLVESSVRRYAANGVYLAVKTYSDGRREIVKVALIR